MKKLVLIVLILFLLISCGGGGPGGDSGKSDDNCGTNGQCGGCCSHHDGVVCIDGKTRCGDGSPLSDTCRNKGCSACVGCSENDNKPIEPCEEIIENKGGLPYSEISVDFTSLGSYYLEENAPPYYTDKGCTDSSGNQIPFPGGESYDHVFTVAYSILPIHKTFSGDSCSEDKNTLGLYFEVECKGCAVPSPWSLCEEFKGDTRAYMRDPTIFLEIKGKRINVMSSDGNSKYQIGVEFIKKDNSLIIEGYFYFPTEDICLHNSMYECYNFPEDITSIIIQPNISSPNDAEYFITLGVEEIIIPMFELR